MQSTTHEITVIIANKIANVEILESASNDLKNDAAINIGKVIHLMISTLTTEPVNDLITTLV